MEIPVSIHRFTSFIFRPVRGRPLGCFFKGRGLSFSIVLGYTQRAAQGPTLDIPQHEGRTIHGKGQH